MRPKGFTAPVRRGRYRAARMRKAAVPHKRYRLILLALLTTAAVLAASESGVAGPPEASVAPGGAQADPQPPSVPQGMAFHGHSRTTVTLAWRAATDDVGVLGYRLFKNGRAVASVTALRYTYHG